MSSNENFNEVISVIIVTYNRLGYLKITIDAVLRQTYSNLEVIVIADGHQLDVDEYIRQVGDSRLSYSYVEHCGYPAKGRNLGIKMTSGKFIAFCDDDDVWALNKLEKQITFFKENDSLVLSCTNRAIIDSNGERSNVKSLKWIPEECNLSNLLMTNYISYSSVLLKREILIKTGNFIDDVKFKAVEDYHLWIRVAYYGQISFLNEILVSYRVHASNITTKLSKGAERNILLFRDLFGKYEFSFLDKLKTYFVAYSKLYVYILRNK